MGQHGAILKPMPGFFTARRRPCPVTIKSILASSFQTLKINPLLLELQRRCIAGGYIRAINYHGVSAETAGNFERQLSYYSARFSSVSLADLDRFFQLKRWDKKYPGLIISFDDGLSSNYSVAAPLSLINTDSMAGISSPSILSPPHLQSKCVLRAIIRYCRIALRPKLSG